MQKLRQIHLYLGCFFAPMILFFALSGVWQEFGLNRYAFWTHSADDDCYLR